MAANGKKNEFVRLGPVLLLVAVLAISCACAIAVLTPLKYNVRAGDIAEETITSPRTIVNTQATETLREVARNETKTVYILDQALVDKYSRAAEKLFIDIDAFRQDAQIYRGNSQYSEWREVLSDSDMLSLLERFDLPVTEAEGWVLLEAGKSDILRLQDIVLPTLAASLESGLQEQSIPAKKTAYVQELKSASLPQGLKDFGEKALDEYLRPTFVADEQATNQARETAAAAVTPIEIKRGDVIVRDGETITQQQYELMRSLELIRAENADTWFDIGVALYMTLIFGCFFAYMLIFRKHVLSSMNDMLIVSAAMALSVALAFALNAIDTRICTSLFGVLLIALLVDFETALSVNAVLALTLGLLSGGRGSSMMGFDTASMTASVFIGGSFAVYLVNAGTRRASVISAGMLSGIASALTVAAIYVMTSKTLSVTLISAAWAFGSNAVATLLVAGVLPLFETLFDVATSARLNELSNANSPLLKQLMTEAPGTYHHSMMTAALAESAAEAIGADALLARVGAYYHDVGKLKRPIYFKENQKPNENIHDTLRAEESAAIIIAHQKDGVAMLNRHKLPSAVVQIAFEHHGTTLAAYFYYKAVKETGRQNLPQKPFRYPGARPTTKESAIVMLADCCEAAVRSLQSQTREEVEKLVDKIIKGKIEDGQLALSPLNFKEVTIIQNSFMRAFNGLLHERIAYPELEQGNKK